MSDEPNISFSPISDDILGVLIKATECAGTVHIQKDMKWIFDQLDVHGENRNINDMRIRHMSYMCGDRLRQIDVIYSMSNQKLSTTSVLKDGAPMIFGNCIITGPGMTSLSESQAMAILDNIVLSEVRYRIGKEMRSFGASIHVNIVNDMEVLI